MTKQHLTASFTVDASPEAAFAAINNVRGWWSGNIEGVTDQLGGEWTYRYQDMHYSKQQIVELNPGKRVVWRVVDSYLSFVNEKDEWTGTTITFDIAAKCDKTEVKFTHVGLSPQVECYGACNDAWGSYIRGSLRSLIENGEGNPILKSANLRRRGLRPVGATVVTGPANMPPGSGHERAGDPLGSAGRQFLIDRQPLLDAVERLSVAGVDRHLALPVLRGIVERTGLEHDSVQTGAAGKELRAAIVTELSRDHTFEIVALVLTRLALRVAKSVDRHQHEHVRRAAGEILARTTMTLGPQLRISRRLVANLAAVTAAFRLHTHLLSTTRRSG